MSSAVPQADLASEEESVFSDLSDREAAPTTIQNGKPKKPIAMLENDSEDEALESLVLKKSKSSWVDSLINQSRGIDFTEDSGRTGKELQLLWDAAAESDDTNSLAEGNDVNLFSFETVGENVSIQALGESTNDSRRGAAWYDSDDDRITVSLASNNMLRKLRKLEGEDVITGREYTSRLQEQYDRLHPQPKWAQEAVAKAIAQKRGGENGRHTKRRRSSVNSNSDDKDYDGASSDGEILDSSILPLSEFLRDIRNLQPSTAKGRMLRPETLDIQRTREMADHYNGPVTSLHFHPYFPSILMSASRSSHLRLHKIDPAAHPTPNPTITTIVLARTGIRRASFLGDGGDQIIMAGRRPFMHSWNLATGKVTKASSISGEISRLEHKTFENFRASPCGRYVAVLGSSRKGGGTLSILNAATMMWKAEAKLDSRGGVADFVWWRNGEGITMLGRDGTVGEYSVFYRMFVATWTDMGNIGGSVAALGGSNGPGLVGTDRWIAIGSKTGIVNIYDRKTLFTKVTEKGGEIEATVSNGGRPEPIKTLEQLVTRVTTAQFSPDGQLLVVASVDKKDALKMVHLPSCTVYRNWPTAQTPLGRVTSVAISQDGYLAVGNDSGRVRLWQIRR